MRRKLATQLYAGAMHGREIHNDRRHLRARVDRRPRPLVGLDDPKSESVAAAELVVERRLETAAPDEVSGFEAPTGLGFGLVVARLG